LPKYIAKYFLRKKYCISNLKKYLIDKPFTLLEECMNSWYSIWYEVWLGVLNFLTINYDFFSVLCYIFLLFFNIVLFLCMRFLSIFVLMGSWFIEWLLIAFSQIYFMTCFISYTNVLWGLIKVKYMYVYRYISM
jgi:hypothetical protein